MGSVKDWPGIAAGRGRRIPRRARPPSGEELRELARLADPAVVAGADALPRHLYLSAVDREEAAVERPAASAAGPIRVHELDLAVVSVAHEQLDGASPHALLLRGLEVADEVALRVGARASLGELVQD